MTIEPKEILFAFPYFFLFIFSLWVSVSPSVSLPSFSFSLIPFPSSRKIVLETADNSTADAPRSDESSLWADEKDDEAMASNWKRQQHENHVFYGAILTPRVSLFPLWESALPWTPYCACLPGCGRLPLPRRRGEDSDAALGLSAIKGRAYAPCLPTASGGVRDPRWI